MLPILSWRSLFGIFLGLIIGVACGFAYSALNASSTEFNSGWPPVNVVKKTERPAYEATVQGRIMPGAADETYIRNMDTYQQYYAARMGSLPFFQYFSDAVFKQYPQYSLAPDQLSRDIKVSCVTLADNPSVIQITAGAADVQEALFLIQNIPLAFQDYILNEQNNMQAELYQKKIKQIEATRSALAQARQDLLNASLDTVAREQISSVTSTKEYIALSARITALQNELNDRATEAASLLAQGVSPAPGDQLSASTTQPAARIATTSEEFSPAVLDAQIKALEEALQQKAWVAAGFTMATGSSGSGLPSTALLNQNYQNAVSRVYTNALNAIELTSTELSKAQAQMDMLQAKINQEKFDQAKDSESKRLAYTLALDNVTSLSAKLDSQTRELQDMSQTVPASQMMQFYIVEAPLPPVPVHSSNGALILGGLLGMFIGWMVVNHRWLINGNPATVKIAKEDDKK
jgi:hypothetical protein